MANPRASESDKITGDKFEELIDRTASGDPGRKREPQPEPEDDEELEIEEEDDDAESAEDE